MGMNNINFILFIHILMCLFANLLLFYFSDFIPRKFVNVTGFLTIFIIGIISLSITDYENN